MNATFWRLNVILCLAIGLGTCRLQAANTLPIQVYYTTESFNPVAVMTYKTPGDTSATVFASHPNAVTSRGIAFGPDGDLYVGFVFATTPQTYPSAAVISRFDGRTGQFMSDVLQDPRIDNIGGFSFGPDGLLYVKTSVFDPANGFSFVRSLQTPTTTAGLFAFNGSEAFVSDEGLNTVSHYRLADGASLGSFVSPATGGSNHQPGALAFDTSGDLLVTYSDINEVHRFNGTTGAFEGVVMTAADGLNGPISLAVSPDNQLFVTSKLSAQVVGFDLNTNRTIGVVQEISAVTWGLTIQQVPEPSSSLSGLGLAGILVMPRRR